MIGSLALFVLAGLFEIGGGWLVWQWLRVGRNVWFGLVGAVVLVLYGVVPTFQSEPNFGRVYAAYGGIFIVLSMLWGWRIDGWLPDKFDLLGAMVCLLGVALIMWAPRS